MFLSLVATLVLSGIALLFRGRHPAVLLRPPMLEPATDPAPLPPAPRPRPAARLALVSGFTFLFFAGAAFTAGAGDRVAQLLDDQGPAIDNVGAVAAGEAEPVYTPESAPPAEPTAPTTAPEPAPAPAPAVPTPLETDAAPQSDSSGHSDGSPGDTGTSYAAAAPVPRSAGPAPAKASPRRAATPAPRPKPVKTRKWVTTRAALAPARAPEIEHGDEAATIWLNRALPDPTPPSARLTRPFARALARSARAHGADWATVLGVLRAQGDRGSAPAGAAELDRLTTSLQGDSWRGALALSGRTSFADRAAALAAFYRAVGLEALVTGLDQAKSRLVRRLLADERVTIYEGGRVDLEAGRIDVRVVVLIAYLAERHGSVTVSSLFSGHRKFARVGVVSAHMYGHAVDIAAVGGKSILGNQQPGGPTEAAVRSILLLPAELQPQQVISLLGLGGPSFPLGDHKDHIHVGY